MRKVQVSGGFLHVLGGRGASEFQAVVDWVEQGKAPDRILASKPIDGGARPRPLCPHPAAARFSGAGSTDAATSFSCEAGPD